MVYRNYIRDRTMQYLFRHPSVCRINRMLLRDGILFVVVAWRQHFGRQLYVYLNAIKYTLSLNSHKTIIIVFFKLYNSPKSRLRTHEHVSSGLNDD